MSKTAMIRARTSPELKEEVESIFNQLGLTTTEAINLFYSQVKLNNGLPFEVKIPNKETLQAIKDVENKKDITTYNNLDELYNDLGI